MTADEQYLLELAAWNAEQLARQAFAATLSAAALIVLNQIWPLRPMPVRPIQNPPVLLPIPVPPPVSV